MSIRISHKHGLNPTIMLCFYCNEEFGIALPGILPQDAEAPRRAVWNREPCPKCEEYMEQGIILISVDEALSTNHDNPWRTGGWVVISNEAFEERLVIAPELKERMRRMRVAFVPDDAWIMLGLPYGDKQPGMIGYGPPGLARKDYTWFYRCTRCEAAANSKKRPNIQENDPCENPHCTGVLQLSQARKDQGA